MGEPGKSELISTVSGQCGIYINLEELADELRIPVLTGKEGTRLRLDFPTSQVIFTTGSPFVIVDGLLQQIPLPLRSGRNEFYAPVNAVLEIFTEHYTGDLFYDLTRNRLLVSKPFTDILGIRFMEKDNQLHAVITTSKPLSCRIKENRSQEVTLFFPEATIDTARLNKVGTPYGLSAIHAEQTYGGSEIVFEMMNGCSFINHIAVDDPPAWIAAFTGIKHGVNHEELNSRLEEERGQWDIDLVVIDPGHGGRDPGAVGFSGIYEKEITLDIGLKIRDYLEDEGIKTVMTRESDIFVPLSERTDIANESGGKLFISLHCNSVSFKSAHGIEVYFLSPTKTERAMQVAMKENSVIKYEETQEHYQELTEEAFILLSMSQANFVKESQDLAVVVHNTVGDATNLRKRGVDQAGFYVLFGASMPSVLFEMGFISNPAEERKLRDKSFRRKLARQISRSIVRFLEESDSNGRF